MPSKDKLAGFDKRREGDHYANGWTVRLYTQEETAEILGVSRTYVQMIEKSALTKFKAALCLDGTAYEYLKDRKPPDGPGLL